jgi:hypothetical protein
MNQIIISMIKMYMMCLADNEAGLVSLIVCSYTYRDGMYIP